ncbi:polysaccharide deacetylase family protein [Bengtsoniella intestinalis]
MLIDILATYDVKTTFFVVGDWAEKYPESVQALADAGHEIQSHSDDHAHYNDLSEAVLLADLQSANDRIAAITGVTPTLIRCPYGEYNNTVISTIRSIGMEPIQWDVDTSHMDSSDVISYEKALDLRIISVYLVLLFILIYISYNPQRTRSVVERFFAVSLWCAKVAKI